LIGKACAFVDEIERQTSTQIKLNKIKDSAQDVFIVIKAHGDGAVRFVNRAERLIKRIFSAHVPGAPRKIEGQHATMYILKTSLREHDQRTDNLIHEAQEDEDIFKTLRVFEDQASTQLCTY
jgi:hypothetical protein